MRWRCSLVGRLTIIRLKDPTTNQIIGMFKEQSDCCHRQCCNNNRAFVADVIDAQGQIIFKLQRPFHCSCYCCPNANDGCCGQEITILDSSDQILGIVRQDRQCAPCVCCVDWMLTIRDEHGSPKWKIGNNLCAAICVCCDDKYLYIYDMQMNKIATITKQWRGLGTEVCTNADSILIEFPEMMTASDKATVIGATLLSDYNLWEQNK